MNNIFIGLKRALKNKNTVTIFAVLICIGLIYFAYNWRIKKATEPVSVPYANTNLLPRTLVTQEMISTRKIAGSLITNDVVRNSSLIIGKYVSNDVEIPEGSLFYNNTVVEWKDMPSSLTDNIPNGNTIVALPVNLETTYGNSIFPGNYIDLYYSGKKNGKLMLGKFIESIKVLSVVDSSGNNIFEKSSDLATPSYIVFSVPEDLHLLLRKALYLGSEIFPVPRNADYSNNPSETILSSTYLKKYILSQTVDVSEKNLTNIEVSGGSN